VTLGTLIAFFLWFMLSFIIANAANQRGRRAIDWFLLSLVTSPVLAALFLLLFPPITRRQPSYSAADDRALQTFIENQTPDDTTNNKASVAILWVIFFILIMLAVLIIAKYSNPASVKDADASASGTPGAPSSETAPQLTCGDILGSLDASYSTQLIDPVVKYIGQQDDLGTPADRRSYLLTECRLRENQTVQEAVDNLVQQKRVRCLPRIPVGGATSSDYDRAVWIPFDKWVRHQGPRPNFSNPGKF
jgi:preprotein translocase subunit SecG